MVKLKLYFKGGIGLNFYFSVALDLLVIGYGIYQFTLGAWVKGIIDLALGLLVGYITTSIYRRRNQLKEQEVEVEKYDEIKQETISTGLDKPNWFRFAIAQLWYQSRKVKSWGYEKWVN